MIALLRSLGALTSPHRRAERLIDEAQESPLSAEDRRWLDAHLETCARCRAYQRRRVRLFEALEQARQEGLRAPEGFVERVRIAAAAGRAPAPAPEPALGVRWLAAGVGAATLALAVFGGAYWSPGTGTGGVQVGGAGALVARDHPNLVIRAPGLGAARFRSLVTELVSRYQGQVDGDGEALTAEVPRSSLVRFLADLEQQGGFEVDLLREPADGEASVRVDFRLD
ncbi:MAG: zf-HC2 domain-containing protein [Myxococcota bacterium]